MPSMHEAPAFARRVIVMQACGFTGGPMMLPAMVAVDMAHADRLAAVPRPEWPEWRIRHGFEWHDGKRYCRAISDDWRVVLFKRARRHVPSRALSLRVSDAGRLYRTRREGVPSVAIDWPPAPPVNPAFVGPIIPMHSVLRPRYFLRADPAHWTGEPVPPIADQMADNYARLGRPRLGPDLAWTVQA